MSLKTCHVSAVVSYNKNHLQMNVLIVVNIEIVKFEAVDVEPIISSTSKTSDITKNEDEDEEYEFEFKISADEYFKIVEELRANDDDLIEGEEILHKCTHEGCKKIFKHRKYLMTHKRRHLFTNFCHLCGKMIKGELYQHLKLHT